MPATGVAQTMEMEHAMGTLIRGHGRGRARLAALAALLAGVVLAGWPAPPAAAQSLAEKGRQIAKLHCSRCHVVAPGNAFGGIGSTPSFMMMVNYMGDWEERFQTFYARRPHPVHIRIEGVPPPTDLPSNAVPINLKLGDVEALVAYVRSLRNEAR
jgi:mono/diheme cytochrome c family protein